MEASVYKIRKAFVLPLAVIVVLLVILLAISISGGQSGKAAILALFFVVSFVVCLETLKREIVVADRGISWRKFFRRREFAWEEITHLGIVPIGKKVYFLLTTTKGFYFFSNLVENHASLIRTLLGKLGEEKVEMEVKNYLDHPVERTSLIVISWIAVLISVGLIVLSVMEIKSG